jgi:hypothetical protein
MMRIALGIFFMSGVLHVLAAGMVELPVAPPLGVFSIECLAQAQSACGLVCF